MNLLSNIIFFSILSGVASLVGGVILLGKSYWIHKFSVHFISFAAGTLLATSFLDLLPEALRASQNKIDVQSLMSVVLAGIVGFFVIEQIILRFHNHAITTLDPIDHHKKTVPMLVTIGDGFHNLIDGIVLAGAFISSAPLGMVTALAIGAHELPQEIGDFSILLSHGWNRKKVLWTNLLVSLANLVGAVITYLLRARIEPFLPYLIALTGGIFIYIAATDLIPQLTSKKPDKPAHVIVLLFLGIITVYLFSRWIEG